MADRDFRAAISAYIAKEAQPPEKFGHQPRLYALTRQVGEGQIYDDDVVYAGGLAARSWCLHAAPAGKSAELQRWDNTAYAMQQAPRILEEFGLPSAKIPAVVEAIRTHQPAQQPTALEGAILRDADILEQLGAIGALRTICKIGRDTRFHDFTSAVVSLESALNRLPSLLRLPSARTLAEPRIHILRAFLEHARAEAGDSLF